MTAVSTGSAGRFAWRSGRWRSSAGWGVGAADAGEGGDLEQGAGVFCGTGRCSGSICCRRTGSSIRRSSICSSITCRGVAGGGVRWRRGWWICAGGTRSTDVCVRRRMGRRWTVAAPGGVYRLGADWLLAADGARERGAAGASICRSLGRVFRDRFLIADVVMTGAVSDGAVVLVRPVHSIRSSRRCCTSSPMTCGASTCSWGGMRIRRWRRGRSG